MSEGAITALVTGRGHEVKNVKEEDGCCKVTGIKDCERVEAYFDPVSGGPEKIRQNDVTGFRYQRGPRPAAHCR